jgi:hypothetical protein
MKHCCQYSTERCEFVSSAQFIKSHEDDCPDRPFNCPFSVATKNICWRGHIIGMWGHNMYEHTAHAE